MGSKLVESLMGAVVLLTAGLFLVFAYRQVGMEAPSGYRLSAAFNSIGGLQTGSDVRINGIKVGVVTGQRLDAHTFQAVVDLSIDSHIRLPADTVATIGSEGLMGGKHVRIVPGRAADHLPPGGAIASTRDYRSLEEMVGEIIFMATGEPSKTGGGLSR